MPWRPGYQLLDQLCRHLHHPPSGQKFVGEFRDDKRNGQGTWTFPCGQKYVDEFRDRNESSLRGRAFVFGIVAPDRSLSYQPVGLGSSKTGLISDLLKKIGTSDSLFKVSRLFHSIFSPHPTFGRSTAMRLTFQARQTRFHSPVTLRKPRSENCLNPITDLMMPKTGSTVCLRMA